MADRASKSRHPPPPPLSSRSGSATGKLRCKQNIFIKFLISGKMAPHIGCNGRQERNVIIIWIKETLIFQREVYHSFNNNSWAAILYCSGNYMGRWREPWMNGTSVSNGTRLSPISISQRRFGNFPESFGKWKTPIVACVAWRFKQFERGHTKGRSRENERVSQSSLSQAPHGFGAPYRGFPAFLSPANCLKTAKLRRLIILRKLYLWLQHRFSRKLLEGWSSNSAKR